MSVSCEAVKARTDGFIRFVSVYVIIVFICLFNCVDFNMQPKIEMVFMWILFGSNFIHFCKKRKIAMSPWELKNKGIISILFQRFKLRKI